MKNGKKICLITPGHIASNPRLVKEAKALINNGFTIHLVFTQYLPYLKKFDHQILQNELACSFSVLDRTSKSLYFSALNIFANLRQRICKKLLLAGKSSVFVAAVAANRFLFWQLKKALEFDADLYIGHNLAALPVAVFAAQKTGKKTGFDAEDFHRNEVSDDLGNADVQLKTILENTFFPKTDYITTSSIEIAGLYQPLFPKIGFPVILNAFPLEKNINPPQKNEMEPVRLFWFSQSIGLNRGLQDVLQAMKILENLPLELHLLGFITEETNTHFEKIITDLKFEKKPVVIFYNPISPQKLPAFASQFDIGLALEPGFCKNNDAALSNKIMTYLQAGLALTVTQTTAQQAFIQQNPLLGFSYPAGDCIALAVGLRGMLTNRNLLFSHCTNTFNAARNRYNWEEESGKFLKIIDSVLAD